MFCGNHNLKVGDRTWDVTKTRHYLVDTDHKAVLRPLDMIRHFLIHNMQNTRSSRSTDCLSSSVHLNHNAASAREGTMAGDFQFTCVALWTPMTTSSSDHKKK
jgi:hypothetical protein